MESKDKKSVKPASAKSGLEGEGSYTATHNYDEGTKEFVDRNRSDIPKMAKDAEKELEGPEGDKLRKAEETGKAKARH